ncbi:hypothetical protein D3C76_1566050 [compost metagenome]
MVHLEERIDFHSEGADRQQDRKMPVVESVGNPQVQEIQYNIVNEKPLLLPSREPDPQQFLNQKDQHILKREGEEKHQRIGGFV